MKKDYISILEAELAKYDLTASDLTAKELAEMLEEAECLDKGNAYILDGYFGGSIYLNYVRFRKFNSQKSEK